MTQISLAVSPELASRLERVSHQSKRTVQSLLMVSLLRHLPALEEAAKYVGAFHVPSEVELPGAIPQALLGPSTPDATPDASMTRAELLTRAARDCGLRPTLGLIGACIRRLDPDKTYASICAEIGTPWNSAPTICKYVKDPDAEECIKRVLDRFTQLTLSKAH